ncbi:CLUMA_CG014608, isoform A [Clunio marinus]|uniref:CLUMA_CG014608, isoform A n=1 Tax=Clunio marinus TaxID=568069 RepID=A0A1J1IML8_9DIPT|nr:CLUMA_CG014608, isoform A [Clunio marinus]
MQITSVSVLTEKAFHYGGPPLPVGEHSSGSFNQLNALLKVQLCNGKSIAYLMEVNNITAQLSSFLVSFASTPAEVT